MTMMANPGQLKTAPAPQPQQPQQPQEHDPFAGMGGGVKLANGAWVPKTHALSQSPQAPQQQAPAPAPVGPQGPQQPQTAGQAVTGNATVGGQVQQGQQTNVAGAFQQALLNRLAPAPLNASDPAIAPAIQANRLAEQRGFERDRAMLAERAAAQGFDNSGGFETELRGLAQDRTMREGRFEGQAVMQRAQERANEITSALMLGGQMLSDQDRMTLQQELARLDAQLRQQGLNVQADLGGRDLALRDKLGSGSLNMQLLGSLMQNKQFEKNLGANLGMFSANLNQQALMNYFR